jgi:hypothetical protein
MGLFDWLWGKSDAKDVAPDHIWFSKRAKLEAIEQKIASLLAADDGPDALFVVAHFPDYLEDLQAAAAAHADDRRLIVTTTDALARIPRSSLTADRSVVILVGQRHLLSKHDDRIVEFARGLGCRFQIEFHVSLDDALMRVFNSEWVAGVLKNLGMKENEAIHSRMVARRIRGAQKKLESVAKGDRPARSDHEWVELNR